MTNTISQPTNKPLCHTTLTETNQVYVKQIGNKVYTKKLSKPNIICKTKKSSKHIFSRDDNICIMLIITCLHNLQSIPFTSCISFDLPFLMEQVYPYINKAWNQIGIINNIIISYLNKLTLLGSTQTPI
jgi:hypothetical protein